MKKQIKHSLLASFASTIRRLSPISNWAISHDRITGLPTLSLLFPRLEKVLAHSPVGLIYIDIEGFKQIEFSNGRETCIKVLRIAADTFRTMTISFGGVRRKIGLCSLGGDDFLVCTDPLDSNVSFQEEYTRFKSELENRLNQLVKPLNLSQTLRLHLAYTELWPATDNHYEIPLYNALKDLTQAAKHYQNAIEHADWRLLRQIMHHSQINILFQPIVSLKDGTAIGYEALARGPAGSKYEPASELFSAADYFNCRAELEELCQEATIIKASGQLSDKYLFLNINPLFLNPVNYEKGIIQNALRRYQIDPRRIVLELTERTEIDDYGVLRNTLSFYRSQGFKVAIDDAGAGYSSLQAIAEIQPEFVKIDFSLIHDIDKSPTKKAMLETISNFCRKINAAIICEGIEKNEELRVICQIGCDYGQGYLFKRPGELEPDEQFPDFEPIIEFACQDRNIYSPNKLGDIAVLDAPLPPDTMVQSVFDMFTNDKGLHGVVICDGKTPVGLLMRERLLSMLSTRYGYDLFIKRKVADIMDHHPLILPFNYGIEDAACQVAQRLEKGLNDYLVVTNNGAYYGVVSVARLLDNMAHIQVEQAQDANPLTRLPGNRMITRRLIDELEHNRSPVTVLYFDLDNFKAFNDYFGFEHGDRVLFLLGELIVHAVSTAGNDNDLVGHIGGDDFIVVTTPMRAEAVAQSCIDDFDQNIIGLYDRDSLQRGYISTPNRQGELCNIPIMTLSIAGVSNEQRNFKNHLELGEAAAEIKKMAKSTPGSCYCMDRRNSIG